MKRLITLAVALVVVGLLGVQCAPAPTPEVIEKEVVVEKEVTKIVEKVVTPTPEPLAERTLVYGLDMEPVGGCDSGVAVVLFPVGNCVMLNSEPLLGFDWEKNDVVPKLAERWELAPDGLSATFYLRKGVKFQDGTDFNADAVVFSFERYFNPEYPGSVYGKAPYRSQFPTYKSSEKIDDYTVKINFTAADPIVLWRFTTMPFSIQSPAAAEKWGDDYTLHAVGTGPYKLVSFNGTERIEMERFEDYWGPKPEAGRIVMLVNTDAQAKVASLLAGELDLIINPPFEQIDQLKEKPGFTLEAYPVIFLSYFNLNMTHPPFDDVRVRKAVNYAIDRDTYANVFSKGVVKPWNTAWIPGAFGYNPDALHYEYNVEKAKQLLDEAGWILPEGKEVREKDGQPLEIRLAIFAGLLGSEAQMAPILISNLIDLGFSIETIEMDQAAYVSVEAGVRNPETAEIALFGIAGQLPDPSGIVQRYTTAALPPNEFNASFYSNPEVDALYDEALQTLDRDEREALWQELQAIVSEDAPWIWMSANSTVMVYNSDKLDKVPGLQNMLVDLANVTFK